MNYQGNMNIVQLITLIIRTYYFTALFMDISLTVLYYYDKTG